MTGLKKGISGGQKHMWLQKNRDIVLQYHQQYGDTATMQKFNLTGDTLYRIINEPGQYKGSPVPAVVKNNIKTVTKQEVMQDIAAAKFKFLNIESSNDNSSSNLVEIEITRVKLPQDDVKVMLNGWFNR